jgi:hypothetical protein
MGAGAFVIDCAYLVKGQFGSGEFAENYRAAVEGNSPKQVRFAGEPGTSTSF